ncbi:MAG: serine hydrolase domain-containing protein [Ferrovibrio sp.]|uniref:serine hydrolase domain-containing protein n=1 Tax=Ferrovibrio sp. TaxID=1917215 RepID=UPI00391CF0C6
MSNIEDLMARHHVPGLSMAMVSGDAAPTCSVYGLRDCVSEQPVDRFTVFEAASLSKPVFAFIILQLADKGILSLDAPLVNLLPNYLTDDPRAATITPRHILSHTAGLPNWRSHDYPLKTYFTPGERFSYSGEGYVYLQRAVEHVCGEPLEAFARRLVFEPLGMTRSSFVWQDRFSLNHAAPHTATGRRFEDGFAGKRVTSANAAGSLYTTADDYARFLQAVLRYPRLEAWLAPRANVQQDQLTSLDSVVPSPDNDVAWTLGWGVETASLFFFHWGDQKGYKTFTMASRKTAKAMVVFTNGDGGLSFMSRLVAPIFPGRRPSLFWLGYEAATD